MPVLTHHRTQLAGLPEQPLGHLVSAFEMSRHKLTRLLSQVQQNGPGLSQCKRLASTQRVVVDDRRHPIAGADVFEGRLELFSSPDIDLYDLVGQRHFFQRD